MTDLIMKILVMTVMMISYVCDDITSDDSDDDITSDDRDEYLREE